MGSFTIQTAVTRAEKFGQLTCGCPNCGVGMAIMIDKETKEAVPVTKFLKAEQLANVRRSATRAADVSGQSSAWRSRWSATTIRSTHAHFKPTC